MITINIHIIHNIETRIGNQDVRCDVADQNTALDELNQ